MNLNLIHYYILLLKMKYLVIVESPSKCKKIEKYLNDNDDLNIYEVVATMGHINELKSLENIDIKDICTLIHNKLKTNNKIPFVIT